MLTAAIDVETTGFNSKQDEILEVGVVVARNGIEIKSFATLCGTEKNSSWEKAMEVNGITPRVVSGLPSIKHYIPFIEELLIGVEVIVCHNMTFDRKFLQNSGLAVEKYTWRCTMKELIPKGAKWPKLTEAAAKYGIEVPTTGLHSALVDAKLCLQVAHKAKMFELRR